MSKSGYKFNSQIKINPYPLNFPPPPLSLRLPQQPNDVDHHKITLEPVNFSFDSEDGAKCASTSEGQRDRTASTLSVGSSDEEFFDADENLAAGNSSNNTLSASGGGARLVPTSRSISVTTIEGDPPDVEEDLDFTETEVSAGEGVCMLIRINFHK